MQNAKKNNFSPIVKPLAHPNTKRIAKTTLSIFWAFISKSPFFSKKGCSTGGVFTCSSEWAKDNKSGCITIHKVAIPSLFYTHAEGWNPPSTASFGGIEMSLDYKPGRITIDKVNMFSLFTPKDENSLSDGSCGGTELSLRVPNPPSLLCPQAVTKQVLDRGQRD
jgi:hypothetical protein